jgi:hypothetical protein
VRPFPVNAEGKRALWDQVDPQLKSAVKAIGGKLVRLTVGGVTYGEQEDPDKVHTFTREWAEQVRLRNAPPSPQVLEAQRLEKLRIERSKRSRGKR